MREIQNALFKEKLRADCEKVARVLYIALEDSALANKKRDFKSIEYTYRHTLCMLKIDDIRKNDTSYVVHHVIDLINSVLKVPNVFDIILDVDVDMQLDGIFYGQDLDALHNVGFKISMKILVNTSH